MNIPSDNEIIAIMQACGGAFASRLAVAAAAADPENLAKIKATWPEYWARYSEMAGNIAHGQDVCRI